MQNILLIIDYGLGDTINTIPVIRTIKKMLPQSLISIYTNKDYVTQLFRYDNDIEQIIYSFPKIKYDVILKFTFAMLFDHRSVLKYRLKYPSTNIIATSNTRSGLRYIFKKILYTNIKVINYESHQIQDNLKLLNYMGLQDKEFIFNTSISLSTIKIALAKSQLSFGKNYIVIPVGASSGLNTPKLWPIKNWIKLISALNNETIILVGHSNEQHLAQDIINSCDNVINLVGKTDILDLIKILVNSKMVISVDNGLAHLAASIGCNIIVLWGPSHFQYNHPIDNNGNNKIRYINLYVPCSSCYGAGSLVSERDALRLCQYNNKCMRNITPEMVFSVYKNINDDIKLIQN